MHEPAIINAQSLTHNGLFGKLKYCSLTPTEYQKMWEKRERKNETPLLRQYM